MSPIFRPGCAELTEQQMRFLWQYEGDCLIRRQYGGDTGKTIQQAAAVPVRWDADGPHVLVITSSSGDSWLVPKGHVELDETSLESACKEAEEEGGVRGTMLPGAIGEFDYFKYGSRYHVQVFLLHVTEVMSEWDESALRKRAWVTCSEAAEMICIEPLADLVRSLPERLAELGT